VVEPPFATVVGAAVSVTVGAVGEVTVTFTDCVAEPVVPVQVSANEELAVCGPVDAVPAIGFAPLQLPEAAHAVALVDDHVSVAAVPDATDGGVTVNVTVGARLGGETPAITVSAAVPPAPLQVSVYAVEAISGPVDSAPMTLLAPLQPPDASQADAAVDDQARPAESDGWTVSGATDSEIVGGGGGAGVVGGGGAEG
jgi:hypothetical protein